MSEFINQSDYDASIHSEILDAVTRGDEAIVEICEDRAIAQMRSYLSARYDCNAIFSARGDERNPLILMMAIDIAIYHIFCAHNPQKLSQMRQDRYDRAVEWLRQVSESKLSIADAPTLPEEQQAKNATILMNATPKRTQHL